VGSALPALGACVLYSAAIMALPPARNQKVRIRRTAARLFAENGYDGTGIQELSDAVGLGRGALYHHIGNKERLLFEIMTANVAQVVDEAEALLEEPIPAEDKVRRLSAMLMATVAESLPEWTVFFREIDALSGRLRTEALRWRRRFEEVWIAVIEQGVAEGSFRELDPVVVKGILGMHNYAYVWLRPRGRLSPLELSQAFCDLLLGGLRQPPDRVPPA
jgi:AcrR family transcriptional regulator